MRPAPVTRRDGLLDVACWCGAGYAVATPAEVRAGRTRSCGRPGCGPGALGGAGPRGRGRRWTPEEDDAVADLIGAGRTVVAVADAVGRTVGSVRGRMLHLGLRLRHRRPVERG